MANKYFSILSIVLLGIIKSLSKEIVDSLKFLWKRFQSNCYRDKREKSICLQNTLIHLELVDV